jgi:two-component system chemotaxis response regulator CheB
VYALVVDDSKPVRSILTRVLEELQFQCHEAANGVEALDQLVRMPRPTLVTLNRHMPEMDGFELLGRLRRSSQFRDLTVVMISTDCDEASITAAKTLGAKDFVGKPFTPSELITRLRSLGVVADTASLIQPPKADAAVSSIASPATTSPTQPATAASPIRLLLVDDSATIRGLLSKTLNAQPGLKVVGTASNGEKALAFLTEETVDVVLLDIEMPVMNGLETLQHLRLLYPRLPVVMFSSLTERGAKATLEALVAGANDYVPKPTGSDANAIVSRIESDLVPKLRAVHRPATVLSKQPPARPAPTKPSVPVTEAGHKESSRHTGVIVVAVSTGGPSALAEVLPRFVGPETPPVVIVQHMPKEFTQHLSQRLTKLCGHPVSEAVDGQPLSNGDVVLAPGGIHIEIVKDRAGCHLAYNHGPPENSCRPSADVLFRSAASVFGKETLALVLTGMGNDGLLGCQTVSAAGGTVLAQDEPTSIVWGMPGQVVRHGLANAVLPLNRIGPDIAMRVRRQHS